MKLHKKAHLISFAQRWEKQLLSLMHRFSKDQNVRQVRNRVTRNNQKFVFKSETRIGTKYEKSPFYQGTTLWNSLSQELQFCDNTSMFEIAVSKQYKVFRG